MVMHNTHQPTAEIRKRVTDMVMCGVPIYIIAEIIDIDDDTLRKYYNKEIKTAKSVAITRAGKTLYQAGIDGDVKALNIYLKTQGADHGWVEKQLIETQDNDEMAEMRAKMHELEKKYEKDY